MILIGMTAESVTHAQLMVAKSRKTVHRLDDVCQSRQLFAPESKRPLGHSYRTSLIAELVELLS